MNRNFLSFEWFPFLTSVILHSRIIWSIRLRWLAIFCYFTATWVAKFQLDLDFPYEEIWWLLGVLGIINIIFYAVYKLARDLTFSGELIILQIHIFCDLIFLMPILHYSGGFENPVYIFYVFHVVMSSIIFPGLIPLFIATLVVILFGSLIYLEYNGIIPHYCVFNTAIHENKTLIYLIFFVFVITVYVSMYICTSFMQIYRNIKRQIDEQNRKLVEIDRQKSQFFRLTSHELKSPIIAIKTAIDGVVKRFSGQIDKRGINLLQRASSRAEQMLNILRELLDLSRNRLAVLKTEGNDFDVVGLLRQTLQEEYDSAEAKGLKMEIDLLPREVMLRGEMNDFKKVFTNIFGNAVHYTPKGGIITVRAKTDKDLLVIYFEDTGIGIDQVDQKKIFEEFFRAENARKMVNFGTGLGLSLSKQIIENHGGKIAVWSELERGSTFVITLPVKTGGTEIEN